MLKRYLILCLFVIPARSGLIAQLDVTMLPEQKAWLSRQKKMHLMTPAEVDQLLPQLHALFPEFNDRLRALSILRLDTPYHIEAIGDGEGVEPNPVFTISRTNCTVQVLTNAALAHAKSYAAAESLMTFINYYPVAPGDKAIQYENRRHYTSDRILTCEYYEDLSSKIAQYCELDSIHITLNRKYDGEYFLPIHWQKDIVVPLIPERYITSELLSRLPPVCGVGIVRKKLFKLGIVVGHEGMVFDGKVFIHASSRAGKVIAEDFLDYCHEDKQLYGIIFYLFKEVK
ncbi:DUF1460 domain-containing protein [candidate division KSB1 bacterium]|nr:DUF1460 domain-containing protein [candidate division KSB1 bacterium]